MTFKNLCLLAAAHNLEINIRTTSLIYGDTAILVTGGKGKYRCSRVLLIGELDNDDYIKFRLEEIASVCDEAISYNNKLDFTNHDGSHDYD